jgi:SAM-dependent methyltransferase
MGIFTEYYRTNSWQGDESVSGTGSSLGATTVIRAALPEIIQQFGITSMLDIPCGDFNWMKETPLPLAHYIGSDIVKELISENNKRYADERRTFMTLDLTADLLPQADMIFCRDCLFHFSFDDISRAIANVRRSGAKFFLTTTNPHLERNQDAVTGEFRPLNLQIRPFLFPKPLILIDEDPTDKEHIVDKHMALWPVSDL